jgi:hypothetical protein
VSIDSTVAGTGFVVTHIPKSYLVPHQCVRPMQYYMRAGSNFEPVPHAVLAGMFGRRPHPHLFHNWIAPPAQLIPDGVAHFGVGLLLINRSPAIARDAYINLMIFTPGGASRIAVAFPDIVNWSGHQVFGYITQIVANDRYKLAPDAYTQPLILTFDLVPPFTTELSIKVTLGCSGAPVKVFQHQIDAHYLQELYSSFLQNHRDENQSRDFVKAVVGARNEGDAAVYKETSW